MEIKGPSWKEIERFLDSNEGKIFYKFLEKFISGLPQDERRLIIQVQVPTAYKKAAKLLEGVVKMDYRKLEEYLSRKSENIDSYGFPYKQDLVEEGFPVYFANKLRLIDAVVIHKSEVWVAEVKANPKDYFNGVGQLLINLLSLISDFKDYFYDFDKGALKKVYPVLLLGDFDEIVVPKKTFCSFCQIFGIGVFSYEASDFLVYPTCFPKFPGEEILQSVGKEALWSVVSSVAKDKKPDEVRRDLINRLSNAVRWSELQEMLSEYGLDELVCEAAKRFKAELLAIAGEDFVWEYARRMFGSSNH